MYGEDYRPPETFLSRKHSSRETATDIEVTVELAHALYEVNNEGEEPSAEYDTPDWHLRGITYFTGPTGERKAAPVHVFLPMNDDGSIHFPVVWVLVNRSTRVTASDGDQPPITCPISPLSIGVQTAIGQLNSQSEAVRLGTIRLLEAILVEAPDVTTKDLERVERYKQAVIEALGAISNPGETSEVALAREVSSAVRQRRL